MLLFCYLSPSLSFPFTSLHFSGFFFLFLDSVRENSVHFSNLLIFLFLGEKMWSEFLCVWLIKPLEKEIMKQRLTETQRISSVDITQQLCHHKRHPVINMPRMSPCLSGLVGSIYWVPAMLQTPVQVTLGNYVGKKSHSHKHKRDRGKSIENIQEKNLILRNTFVVQYTVTWMMRKWLQWQKQPESGGDCLVRPGGIRERWLEYQDSVI